MKIQLFIFASLLLLLSGCNPPEKEMNMPPSPVSPVVQNLVYREPDVTFSPFLLKEERGSGTYDMYLSVEWRFSDNGSETFIEQVCSREQIPAIEECSVYKKIWTDFLNKYNLTNSGSDNKAHSTVISEVEFSGSNVMATYALGFISKNIISKPAIAWWNTKNYIFDDSDFSKKVYVQGRNGEDTSSLTRPLLSTDQKSITTTDVTADIKTNDGAYGQSILENIPFYGNSGATLSLSFSGISQDNMKKWSGVFLSFPHLLPWNGVLYVSASGAIETIPIKNGINISQEKNICFCNVDTCNISFSPEYLKNLKEIQIQY